MEQNTPLEKNTMESAPCGFSIAMNKAAVSARTAVRRKRIIRLEENASPKLYSGTDGDKLKEESEKTEERKD